MGGGISNLENKRKSKEKRIGISLIVLVITILVIIVLAGAVILTVSKNNPLKNANEAVYKSDLKNFLSDLNLYVVEDLGNNGNVKEINAINNELEKYIPSIKGKTEYTTVLQIVEGKLYIIRDRIAEEDQDRLIEWAEYVGIGVIGLPTVPIVTKLTLEPGTDKIKAKIDVTDSASGIVKYIYEISEYKNTWTKQEATERKYIFTGLKKQTKYYVRVIAEDKNGNKSEPKIGEATTGDVVIEEGSITFDLVPNLGEGFYTNQNVTVTINYPEIVEYKGQYSYDTETWTDYIAPLTITKNLTIYTRMIDEGENETDKHPSRQIDKIDKLEPKRFTPAVSEVNTNSLKITGNAIDAEATADNGSSGIRGYQYRVDEGVWTSEIIAKEYTFTGLNNKVSHNLSMRAIDRAGNRGTEEIVSKQIGAISDNITFVLNPNLGEGYFTNKNVTVTINYPVIIGTTKKYSYDGRTWSDYTAPLSIDVNKTVYAKLIDSVGNESKVKTVEINKIDKTAPSIPSVKFNSGVNECRWQNNINIALSSTDNLSGIVRYEIDWAGNGVANANVGNPFIPDSGHTSDNNRFRSVDKAGNVSGWSGSVHIHMDTTAPVHTNWWWGPAVNGKASLYIQATDNVGIQRVQGPSSTEAGGYTNWQWIDAVWDVGAKAYRVDVNTQKFSYYGNYKTDLYIYDPAGNGGRYNQTAIDIPYKYNGNGLAVHPDRGSYRSGDSAYIAPNDIQYGPYNYLKAGTYNVKITGDNLLKAFVRSYVTPSRYPPDGFEFTISNLVITNTTITYKVVVTVDCNDIEFTATNGGTTNMRIDTLEVWK